MIAVLEKSKPTNFAELHERLGGVPLERIRLTPYPGSATEADLETNGDATCELIDGVLVEKAVGTRESLLSAWICQQLGNFVEVDDLGVVLGEAGLIRLAGGQVRAPDATFIPWSSFPHEELPLEEYWSIKPALIVEVQRLRTTSTARSSWRSASPPCPPVTVQSGTTPFASRSSPLHVYQALAGIRT